LKNDRREISIERFEPESGREASKRKNRIKMRIASWEWYHRNERKNLGGNQRGSLQD
jgi:hypothetical protein